MPTRWRGELPEDLFHKSMMVEVRWRDTASADHVVEQTFPAGNQLNTGNMIDAFVDEHMLLVGHRGSPQKKVENTMPSYAEALAVDGVNAIEIDLCFTREGEVVIWHDWDPNEFVASTRQSGLEGGTSSRPHVPPAGDPMRRRVSQLTLAELRANCWYVQHGTRSSEHIPTFAEFIAWASQQPTLLFVCLDMKIPSNEVALAPAMAARMDAILNQYQPSFPVLFMSPEENVHDALRAALPHRMHSLDRTFAPIFDTKPSSAMSYAIPRRNRAASIGRPVVYWTFRPFGFYSSVVASDQNIRATHNADPANTPVEKYICWTIDSEDEISELMAMHVE